MTFHRLLEINEQEFMAAVQATFKLGIGFENWRDQGENYIHSFGVTGHDHWTAGFQHFWLKGRERGLAGDFGDYCLELRASLENKFAHLPSGQINYAFHIDASLYAKFLRKFSEPLGVKRIEGKIVEVKTDPASGFITALKLDSGDEIDGDLFIDCTGFRGLLIEQTLHAGYEDWSHWLPCDSAVAVQTESVGDAIPYTRSIARGSGWQWRIPLQHRVGNGMVYCSRYLSDEQAKQELLANVEGRTLTEPRVIKFRPGQRRKHWSKNCVAIGLVERLHRAAGVDQHPPDPARASSACCRCSRTRASSRRTSTSSTSRQPTRLQHIRDFIVLHYHVTHRRDTPFWRYCADMDIPASLAHRIDLFRETGRVFRAPNELFAENSWIQVMLGQGIVPEQYHPIVDVMSDEELRRFLQGIKSSVDQAVAGLPRHQVYVEQYCKAAP